MRHSSVNILYLLLALCAGKTDGLSFSTIDREQDNFAGDILDFVDRIFVPYGPDLVSRASPDEQPWAGYGYGMGATAHWAYDYVQGFIYSQSDAGGYITVIDYQKLPGEVSQASLDLTSYRSEILDIALCPEQGLLFASLAGVDKVLMFDTVKRKSRNKKPTLIEEIDAGVSPGALKLSNDCSTLAVANRNEGISIINEGALHLVTDFLRGNGEHTVKTVFLNEFDELELVQNQVHMPLTKRALQFFNKADSLGMEELLDNWNPAIALDPEYMAFSEDGSELFLNLQGNSAMARINVASAVAESINGYGLKAFTEGSGVDLVNDGDCKLYTNPCLHLLRAPDTIEAVEIDGVNYVLTADEGSSYKLRDFEEKRFAGQVFAGDSSGISGMTFASDVFTEGDVASGCQANFNTDCDDGAQSWCEQDFEISLGSSAIDYSDPTNPIMSKIVGFGGRGISIFRVPSALDDSLELVWDSGSEFELNTCNRFKWAHNSLQNEEFAPVDSPAYILGDDNLQEAIVSRNDALDNGCEYPDLSTGACAMGYSNDEEKATADGMAVEAVTVGVACSRLVAIGCGESNAMCFLYDITDIESPVLRKTFNLSPASNRKNPERAYADRSMGDIGSETILFVNSTQSPTGKTGVMFGGSVSGTISFFEFVCESNLEFSASTKPSGMAAIALCLASWVAYSVFI